MTKKILLIIGILVIIGLAIFLVLSEKTVTPENGGGGFSLNNYFPFGKNEVVVDNNTDTSTSTEPTRSNQNINQPIPKVRKISNEPVAGAITFNSGTTTIVRFVERGTGNVYEARSDSAEVRRLTNTTIPKIIRAIWLNNGSGFLAQTLLPENEIIETSFVSLVANQGGTEALTPFSTKISKLPTDIKEILVSTDSKKIFYYTISNGASFYLANPDGTGAKLVVSHPLSEWIPRYWKNASTVVLQTKESGRSPALFYALNTQTGTFSKEGSPIGKIQKSVATIADKCALPIGSDSLIFCAVPESVPNNFPDSWYKGALSTTDSIMEIDTLNNVYYNKISLATETDQKIDVSEIWLANDKKQVVVRNKIDGQLWMIRLED